MHGVVSLFLTDNCDFFGQILHLQKVLIRKRDPVTHVLFADLLAKAKVYANVF